MTLNGVPWREALDVIVKATGYAWVEQEYSIVRVVAPDKLQKDLSTKIFPLNYQKAPNLAKVITELRGKEATDLRVVIDEPSNSLVVTATPPVLASIDKTIHELDSRTREVQIEMKFVEFSNSDAQRIGFNPMNMTFNIKDIGRFSPTFTPFNDNFGGGMGYNTRYTTSTEALKSTSVYPLLSQASSLGTGDTPMASGVFSADFAFEAISTLSSAELLQAPQLLTLDNTPATIKIGREIRYAESTISESGGVGTQQVTLKEAQGSPVKDGIDITVTPHITSDGFVSIILKATNEKATLQLFTNGKQPTDAYFNSIQLPQKDTTLLSSTFMVADGKTVVIGGILSNAAHEETRQIPVLGSIPVLGWLFKKQSDSVEQRNLTIFITPHIIPTDDAQSEYSKNTLRMRERVSGLNLNPTQSDKPKSTGPE
jgi:type IV pilus assembly protein PilQ